MLQVAPSRILLASAEDEHDQIQVPGPSNLNFAARLLVIEEFFSIMFCERLDVLLVQATFNFFILTVDANLRRRTCRCR